MNLRLPAFLLLLVVMIYGSSTLAACATPAGTAGEFQWITASSVYKYCDGTNWISLTSSVTGNACTTAREIKYNASEIQFCNGSFWVSANGQSYMGSCSTAGEIIYDSGDSRLKWCNGTSYKALGAPPDVTSSLVSTSSSAVNATSYTFSAMSFGAASSSRYMVVGISFRSGATNSISSVTIGGVAATLIGTAYETTAFTTNAFYLAYVPTGTSGDVVVNTTASAARIVVGLWRVLNLQSTTVVSQGDQTGATNFPLINVSAGGVVLGVTGSDSGTSVTWTGATEDYDFIVTDTLNLNGSGASQTFATAQTNYTVTITTAGSWTSRGGKLISLR